MRFTLKTKISTPAYRETRRFYETVFGLPIAEEWDEPADTGVIYAMPDGHGEAFLEVYRVDDARDPSLLSLQFRVDSLDAFRAGLPADVEVEGPVPRPWGSRYLYLRDPNGIQVVVFEGGL